MKNSRLGVWILIGICFGVIAFFILLEGVAKLQDPYNTADTIGEYKVAPADEAAEEGDAVVIDYVGTVDGVAFEGGTADDYVLVLGSDTFIPGFEDQLVGAKTGDDVTVEVTFPEDYSSPELAGQNAIFETHIDAVLNIK